MFFDNMFGRNTNWDNQDYRDYLDHRTRSKRRLRRRLTLGVTLLVCLLLILALGTVNATVRAQPAQPIAMEPAPALSAPVRLQVQVDPAAGRESQGIKAQAAAPIPKTRATRAAAAPANAAQAARLVGLIYLHGGSGVARDPIQAALWFERARVLGKPLPKARLAWCEIEGCQRSPDPAGARRETAQQRSSKTAQAE
jgi:hypothetical protein